MSLKQPGLKVITLAERLTWESECKPKRSQLCCLAFFQQIWAESGSIHLI